MKSKFTIAVFVFIICSVSVAQIPTEYPFKTYLDNMNNLNITGHNIALDVESRKFSSSGSMLWKKDYPNQGFDRAYDLAVDEDYNVIVCGFVADKVNANPRAIILKHRNIDGFIEFDQKPFPEIESGSYGIAVDDENNFFSCGYILNSTNRDILIAKLNMAGDTLWTRTYNNPSYNKDDVATDILIDGDNLYVIG